MAAKPKKSKAPRKPHNASSTEYGSFNELLDLVGAESRTALIDGEEVSMPRRERLLRVMVNRAHRGNVRDVIKILQLMAKYPAVAATFRDETLIVVSGALCNV